MQASYFKETDRAPIDLCCIIDESSSMSGDRIALVKQTVSFVLRNLTDKDRFGIVGYGSSAHRRLELTKMDDQGKKKAEEIVKTIHASGMTALCEGLEFGIKMMMDNRNKDDSNQIASLMLFTDGQANVGPSTAVAIQKQIEGRGNNNNNNNNKNDVPVLQKGKANRRMKMSKMSKIQKQQQQVQGQPAAQQQQQQAQGQAQQGQQAETKQDDEKEKENEKLKTNEGSADYSLPCTINTFGFGNNHNESLLEALAEWGRGMYTFIENTDVCTALYYRFT